MRPKDYDAAVKLLTDLSDLGRRSGRAAEVRKRIRAVRDEHKKKSSFISRLERASLIAGGRHSLRREST